ncbi:MAG: helix-turn-helix domain-containing protein [Bdellovibrio sp.]|nr:helix-turn-helix domain-containing protein [Bdellovibrio sp.]
MKLKRKELSIEHINTPQQSGIALRRLRNLRGLTQTQLAKLMNMRQSTISDIENGRGTLDSFFKIIQALKVNLCIATNDIKVSKKAGKSKAEKLLELMYTP